MDHLHPTFLPIRKNSTLIAFGDCFLDDKKIWRITCIFRSPNDIYATVTPVVEILPALALRRVYSVGKITVNKEDLGYFQLPSVSTWKKRRVANVPPDIYKAYYVDACKLQWVYQIEVGSKVVWIPVLELARILFLKTAENARYAFYETNLLGMASLDFDSDQSIIRLSKQYPRRLLDTKLHQQYLAWLLLNRDVTDSFCSMFEMRNAQSINVLNQTRWTFDFAPPELEGAVVTVYGKEIDSHFFVNEITSVGRVPTNPRYKKVIIEHPEDIKYKWKATDGEPDKKPKSSKADITIDPNVDDSSDPSTDSKPRILAIPRGRLFFSVLMEPKRHFTEVEVEEKKKGGKKGSNNRDKENVNTGVTEGDTKSKNRKVDFQALKDPDVVPTDFFKHIRTALQKIQDKGQWQIRESVGELTDENDRFFSKVLGIRRRYFCGEIRAKGDNVITLIEIDLSDKHGLATLLIRLPPEDYDLIEVILDSLVEHAGHWNKAQIDQVSDLAAYIAHPKNLVEGAEKIDYDRWAGRIIKEL